MQMDRRLTPATADVKARRVLVTRRRDDAASEPTTEPLMLLITAALCDVAIDSALM